eukprot:scaffold5827_cov80-Phaeocystis_antarctica.AAC.1
MGGAALVSERRERVFSLGVGLRAARRRERIVRGVGVYVDLTTDGRAAAAPRRALHLNFGQVDVAYTGVAASSGPVHEALHAECTTNENELPWGSQRSL